VRLECLYVSVAVTECAIHCSAWCCPRDTRCTLALPAGRWTGSAVRWATPTTRAVMAPCLIGSWILSLWASASPRTGQDGEYMLPNINLALAEKHRVCSCMACGTSVKGEHERHLTRCRQPYCLDLQERHLALSPVYSVAFLCSSVVSSCI